MNTVESLNPEQKKVVIADNENMLVLAGAGSGKTSVLTHRTAWLVNEQGIPPMNILAVTFTNKAAKEMRSRVESLLDISTHGMWIGTFHGIAHRLLRRHAGEIGLDPQFKILDQDDQLQIVKKIVKDLNIDDKIYPPRTIRAFIGARKDEGVRADSLHSSDSRYDYTYIKAFQAYETQLRVDKALDFADLLLYVHDLFDQNEGVRRSYQDRFKVILVDEFQDTNKIQYDWLKLLVTTQNSIMAVGDDDQSIYGWRGAKVENIFKFQKEYAPVSVIKLEQNYRSTQTILDAANAVIANNEERMGKNLWSDGDKGEPIAIYEAVSERDEAAYVSTKIADKLKMGVSADQVAILYRSNAQSRVLEEALITQKVSYRIYGGVRYFERAEIKDALAYLRLIAMPEDNLAFERIINVPTRGIGLRTIDKIREYARDSHLSLWASAEDMVEAKLLPAKALNAIKTFIVMINGMKSLIQPLGLADKIKVVLEGSGLLEFHGSSKHEKAQQKLENMQELVNAAQNFNPPVDVVEEQEMLQEFLAFAVLESGESQADENTPAVQLMTLHSAKGLEFPHVYMVGLEEGLFPTSRSVDMEEKLSEERRLCYVGITRAMKALTISYATSRFQYGESSFPMKSRFLNEIPKEHTQSVRMGNTKPKTFGFGVSPTDFLNKRAKTIASHTSPVDSQYKQGDIVEHAKFGMGVFLGNEGDGEDARLHVDFKGGYGAKVLVAKYARLTKIS
jgi:DNA helicase II / ATP-dependent DNA helicase PcrA